MTIKYSIHNQLTGLQEEALTFEDAKVLQARIKADYLASIEGLFIITVLTQNEDGSWTQSVSDGNGNPIIYTFEEIEQLK
jgi:hypothetical protein